MRLSSQRSLEKLSSICYGVGIGILGLGFGVILFEVLHQRVRYLSVCIFIITSGYAFTKIADKIDLILKDEKKHK